MIIYAFLNFKYLISQQHKITREGKFYVKVYSFDAKWSLVKTTDVNKS